MDNKMPGDTQQGSLSEEIRKLAASSVYTQGSLGAMAQQALTGQRAYVSPKQSDFEERGTEEQIALLYASLAKARLSFGEIKKDASVSVWGKDASAKKPLYTFKYAPMENLLAATERSLATEGISVLLPFTRDSENALVKQMTIIAHAGGARLVFTFFFDALADIKQFGGQTTYYQRYAYRSALSLAADGDMDEMPEAPRGESRVEQPQQQQTRQVQTPLHQTKSTAPALALEARVGEMRDAVKSLGFTDRAAASAFIFKALNREPMKLGDPFGSLLTSAQIDKVCQAVVDAKVAKQKTEDGQ